MADDAVPIPLDLKLREYAFQLQDSSLSRLHEKAGKAFWESIEKNGKPALCSGRSQPLTWIPRRNGSICVDLAINADTAISRSPISIESQE